MHVNLYYLAHRPSILQRYGDRGYRLAQLEGALHAGKLHQGTHALGLGAVGSIVTVFGRRRRTAPS